MRPEVLSVADEMCQQFWNVILNDGIQDMVEYQQFRRSFGGGMQFIFPEEHLVERRKALNAMSAFGVLKFNLIEELDTSDAVYPFPTGNYICFVKDFDNQTFLKFCDKYKIELHDNPNVHFAMLEIGKDNIPIITIKGEKYAYDKIAPSTFCDIMKVAIHFQNDELSTDELNRKGSNDDIIKKVLNGRKLHITKKKYGLVRNYVNPIKTLPEELLYFFEFSNGGDSIKYVMPTELDDEKLGKILETTHKL